MANTRKSTKRAGQALKRQSRNQMIKSSMKSAVGEFVAKTTKENYIAAIRSLSKAASKGAIPKERASRKISRLTIKLNAAR